MSYLQKIVYLTEQQYASLATGTLSGHPERVQDDVLYITTDPMNIMNLEGTLSVNKGGTGAEIFPVGSLLVGNGTNPLTTITKTSDAIGGTVVVRDSYGDFSAHSITTTASNWVLNTANNTAGLVMGIESQSYKFGLHMGTGGINHGLYDWRKNGTGTSGWVLLADANNNWTFNGNATSATNATNATNATSAGQLTNKSLTTTTVNNTSGSYAFSIPSTTGMSQITTSSTDYVGLQIGDNVDKWQLTATGNSLFFRQNDSGGTTTSWNNWVKIASSANVSTGSSNGTINIAGTEVSVYGLQALAYKASLEASDIPNHGEHVPTLQTSNQTTYFLRGDNSWSDTLTSGIKISNAAGTNNLTGITVENTSVPHSIGLRIGGTTGSGGLVDITNNKWIVYSDTSGNVTLNGNANTATTASKLTTSNLGSATKPIYLVAGVATECTELKDLAYVNKPSSNKTTTYLRGDGTWVSLSDMGLSNALHFIGITSTELINGSTTSTLVAKTTGSLSKTTGFVDGDVVMDGDQLREYVWSGSAWRLLGITTSTAYSQTATGNSWITSITQGTDGKITATTGSLVTTGEWDGNANTATSAGKWTTAQNISISDSDGTNTGTAVSVDGSAAATLKLPTTIKASLTGNADTATSLTNFVVSTYTIPASKGVRIKYPAYAPVLISCQRSTGGSRLILIGGGYGEEGTVRNDFTELVSPSETHFTWSMPQTTGYGCTIEIMHHDTSGTATVWVESTAACTFTEITALTSTKTNRNLLHSANTAAGANNAATLAWNTTYTIAKINGTDIKFTTMAKPTYAFTDLTSHPTTLADYGISSGYGDTTNPYGNKNANTILAGPSTGTAAAPNFRQLVAADIPDLSWNKITSDKPAYTTRWPAWNEIAQSGANSIAVGDSPATAGTEILTSYATDNGFASTGGVGKVYRRAASKVINSTLVKAALSTDNSTTNQWLNKKGEWSTPTAAQIGAIALLSNTTDNAIVRFDDTHGAIQDSGVIIDDNDNLSIPKTLCINGYTGYGLCKFQNSGNFAEIIIKTKFKFVSSSIMPTIHIHGHYYGDHCPIDLSIVYYIFENEFYTIGITCKGGFRPDIYLFKYTENNIDYVAVGLKATATQNMQYIGFQVDADGGALGTPSINPTATLSLTNWTIESATKASGNTLIPAVNTDKCKLGSYITLKTSVTSATTATNITGTLALINLTKGSENTALMGTGTSNTPAYVSVSPSISFSDMTTSTPKINLSVLNISDTQNIPVASTNQYGITKLYDGVDSTSTTLAATANAVKIAYDKANGITAASLGLSKAMNFLGVATVTITDGGDQDPKIGGNTTTVKAGDVVIDSSSSREYVWSTTGEWELLGNDVVSYKTLQSEITDTNASPNSTTTFVQAVTQDQNGVITVTKAPLNTSGNWDGTAATAAELATKPSLNISATDVNAMTITAGGKTSDDFTVPHAITTKELKSFTANSNIWSTGGINAGAIKYVHNINKDTSGLFPNTNNANGILIINTHPNNNDNTKRYHHELGFSGNGKLFHRAILAANLDNTTTWEQIAYISNIPTNLNELTNGPGYVTSSGVTSITLKAGAGITLDTDDTAITSTGSRTISISGIDTSSGSETQCLTKKGTWKTFGTSNLTIGTTSSTAMAGNTVVNKVKTTVKSDDVEYKILGNAAGASPTSGSNYEAIYDTNITMNPSTSTITANTFTGTILKLNVLTDGSGTIGGDKGSGANPRYVPSKWYFNAGITPVDGDIITIKVPVAGSDRGVYLSVDNQTTYYPVIYNTNSYITTHFGANACITLYFDSSITTKMYALNGQNNTTTSNVTGAWRVLTLYDSGNTNTLMRTYALTSTTELPILAGSTNTEGAWDNYTSSYKNLYGTIASTTANRATINPSTGHMTVPGGITGNASTATTLQAEHKIWGHTFNGSADVTGDLDWDNQTYRQRIHITDDSTADTAVFTFQQSEDAGTNYSDLFTIKDNGNVIIGKRITSTAPSSATTTNRIEIIPYYHNSNSWYIASKDDSTNAHLVIKYGTNERNEIRSDGRIFIYSTVGAGSSTVLGILNVKTTTTINNGDWSWGLNHLASGVNAGGNTCLVTGVANTTNNAAVLGFHYAGSDNAGNYAEISLFNNNGLLKVFKTGQVSITTNISSSDTSTGSLVVAGGAGIGEKLYVGDAIHTGNITIGGDTNEKCRTIVSSNTLYLDRPSTYSILFRAGGTSVIQIDPDNHFKPYSNTSTSQLGTSDYNWAKVYSKQYIVENNVVLQWNSTDQSLDFIFA